MKPWLRKMGMGLIAALAICHFTLAGISAANRPITRILGTNAFTKAMLVYEYLTGTGNCFGFFAPGVISQIQVGYKIKKGNKILKEGIIGSEHAEVSLRLHNLTQQFWNASRKPEVRRALAASLAGQILSQNRDADSVEIGFRSYVLPSMAEFREGKRPSWENNYAGNFSRGEI